jgi:hypothetical protein
MGLRAFVLASGLALPALASATTVTPPPEYRFRQANDRARAGDYPAAIAEYEALAAAGTESASLYWNWAQAAGSRGERGESLWALLRARELDPGDRAVVREVERLRASLNLDPAEIAPEPLISAARFGRSLRLDLIAIALLALSVVLHAWTRLCSPKPALRTLALASLGLGLLAGILPAASGMARPTAVVVRRGAPLLDAASPTASSVGALREGEVVPILEASGDWVRLEDSSGARGWAARADVRPLRAPSP